MSLVSVAMLALPHFRGRVSHRRGWSREVGQGLGRRGADFAGVLRAASGSPVLINIDKVTSRRLTLLNSNLIITFHTDIKTSQMAAAMCAGGEIGGLQALEKFF